MPSSDRLRICLVSTFYPPYNFGGDGIFAHRLANALARRGHHVRVLHHRTAYRELAGSDPKLAYDDHPGVNVVGLDVPFGKAGLLWLHQSGGAGPLHGALRRWLQDESYDVIHYNNVSLLGGPAAFSYGSALKLCTLSDHWLVCPMHGLWRMGREQCERATCVRCTIHGRRPPQWWRVTGRMAAGTKLVDLFLAPSDATIESHRARGLAGEMLRLPLFHVPPQVGPPENSPRPYFLYAGRIEELKGPQDLLPYFASHPDIDLVVAGAGDLEPILRRAAEAHPNIRLLGRVDAARLQSLYAGAVATVVPSRCHETFGLVVVESFSAGTPVVVRDHSALREIVARHGGGLAYSDDAGLAGCLDALRQDGDLRARLARQGRDAFAAEFVEDVFVDRYLAQIETRRSRASDLKASPRSTAECS